MTHAWISWSQLVATKHSMTMMGILANIPDDSMAFFVWAVRWGSAAALVAMVGSYALHSAPTPHTPRTAHHCPVDATCIAPSDPCRQTKPTYAATAVLPPHCILFATGGYLRACPLCLRTTSADD